LVLVSSASLFAAWANQMPRRSRRKWCENFNKITSSWNGSFNSKA